jgi:transposase-like protein
MRNCVHLITYANRLGGDRLEALHGLHPNLVSQWRHQTLAGMASVFSRTKEAFSYCPKVSQRL